MILLPGMKEFETILPMVLGSMRLGEFNMRALIREVQSKSSMGGFNPKQMHSGSFSRTVVAGSGTVTISGVPFKPFLIFFLSANTTEIAAGGASVGFGFDPDLGLTKTALFRLTGTGVYWAASNDDVRLFTSTGNEWQGNIAASLNTGFTFTWTKTGTPGAGADVSYSAFRRM